MEVGTNWLEFDRVPFSTTVRVPFLRQPRSPLYNSHACLPLTVRVAFIYCQGLLSTTVGVASFQQDYLLTKVRGVFLRVCTIVRVAFTVVRVAFQQQPSHSSQGCLPATAFPQSSGLPPTLVWVTIPQVVRVTFQQQSGLPPTDF